MLETLREADHLVSPRSMQIDDREIKESARRVLNGTLRWGLNSCVDSTPEACGPKSNACVPR